ncbi:hypothetical protein JW859_03825 [bacterium]|nr:hypothetical protein [bacterium]
MLQVSGMGMDQVKWYIDWCEPVVVALYKRDRQAIIDAIGAAQDAIISADFPDQDRECLLYQITYLEYQCQSALKDETWMREWLPKIFDRMAKPSMIPQAEKLRRRLNLQFRMLLDQKERKMLEPPEFEQMFRLIPQEEYSTELWHYIASWAFRYSQPQYVKDAYEFAVTNAHGFNVEWSWQRVHVMWQMVTGKAKPQDLIWLIKGAEIVGHLISFKNQILPRALELGLVTERVEVVFRERSIELNRGTNCRLEEWLKPHLKGNGPPPAAPAQFGSAF